MALLRKNKFTSFVHAIILFFVWRVVCLYMLLYMKTNRTREGVFLVTADTDSLIGSKGDEAMTLAAMAAIRKVNSDLKIFVACSANKSREIALSKGLIPVGVWGGVLMPFRFFREQEKICPNSGLIMGADLMDGHYSIVTSLRMIIAADLLARGGASTAFLGFSMNSKPSFILKYAFRMLAPNVRVNLRDPVSYERYKKFTGIKAHLVADTAFLLQPQPLGSAATVAANWIQAEKSKGRLVVALNFHPLLFKKNTLEDPVAALTSSLLKMIGVFSEQYSVSWILLPHDDRPDVGDIDPLSNLHGMLGDLQQKNVFLVDTPPAAAEIKTLVANLDGVITGRMHLAIAALGQTVPIMVFAYQGKFQGLFQHFELPEWLLLDPVQAGDISYLTDRGGCFIRELVELKAQVQSRLDYVHQAAESNFEKLQ